MAIATQYKAHSLIRHMQRGWGFFRAERNEYLDILPASQRVEESKWYLGTADAVTQNIDIVDSYGIKYVVILAGDHIYKMDYEIMLQQHVDIGRRCDHRLPDRAADGGHGLWRDGMSTQTADHRVSGKARRSARAFRAIPTMRWPRWGSMSSTGHFCAIC